MLRNSVRIRAEKVMVTMFRKELSKIKRPMMKITTP
jgi:hypothetical protein